MTLITLCASDKPPVDDNDDDGDNDDGQHILLQLSGSPSLPRETDQLGREQVKAVHVPGFLKYMSNELENLISWAVYK